MLHSQTTLAPLLLGGFITAVLVVPMLLASKKLQLVSVSDFRRNNKPVPLVGGICIFLGVAASVFALGGDTKILAFALPIFLVGILDDRFELSARPKFTVQILTVGGWLYSLPLGSLVLDHVGCGHFTAMALTAFLIIGAINAMNMIDGMDGEATGFSIIAALGLCFISPQSQHLLLMKALTGSCLGFMLFNRPQAKAYLGDCGSTTLGFLLISTASTTPLPESRYEYLAPLFIFAFPLMDAVLAVTRRILRSSNLFKGDRDHIHHKLLKVGFSVPQALGVIYFIAAYCGGAAYLLTYGPNDLISIQLPILLVAPLMLLSSVFYVEGRLARQMVHLSRSLLLTHLPINKSAQADRIDRYAITFDLITYYHELQNRGFMEVNTFINDFGQLVKTLSMSYKCYLFGSYTIILTFQSANDYNKVRSSLISDFKALLLHNGLLKNADSIPLGVKFYGPDSQRLSEILSLLVTPQGSVSTADAISPVASTAAALATVIASEVGAEVGLEARDHNGLHKQTG